MSDKGRFNYASAIFRSFKRQKLDSVKPEGDGPEKNRVAGRDIQLADNQDVVEMDIEDESEIQVIETQTKMNSQESSSSLEAVTYEVDELREQAIQRLKQEAARNAERAKSMGTSGWAKPKMSVNTQALGRMMTSASRRDADGNSSSRRDDRDSSSRRDDRNSSSRRDDRNSGSRRDADRDSSHRRDADRDSSSRRTDDRDSSSRRTDDRDSSSRRDTDGARKRRR